MVMRSVPGWMLWAGTTLVAAIFAAGTIALLLLGRPVPEQLWMIDIGIGVAYFGSGPFSQIVSHNAAVHTQLLDTVNHSIATTNAISTAALSTTAQTISNKAEGSGNANDLHNNVVQPA